MTDFLICLAGTLTGAALWHFGTVAYYSYRARKNRELMGRVVDAVAKRLSAADTVRSVEKNLRRGTIYNEHLN